MLEAARETLGMVNEILLSNDYQAMRHQLAVTAQAEATLAVAEELRALREHFEGGAVEVHYGGSVAP